MKKNNFGLQWLCQEAKDISCAFPGQHGEILAWQRHAQTSANLLGNTVTDSCLNTYTKSLGLRATVSWALSTPRNTRAFAGTANRQLTGNPCCRSIVATLHMAWELVTECTNMIINPRLLLHAPLPLSASHKNHLQTVPSSESDTSQKCKVTASTWNALQSLPLRQTNPSV